MQATLFKRGLDYISRDCYAYRRARSEKSHFIGSIDTNNYGGHKLNKLEAFNRFITYLPNAIEYLLTDFLYLSLFATILHLAFQGHFIFKKRTA